MEKWSDGSPARVLGETIKVRMDYITAIPIMEVRAPRGEMIIYKSDPIVWDDTKSEAIRAFMEEHRND